MKRGKALAGPEKRLLRDGLEGLARREILALQVLRVAVVRVVASRDSEHGAAVVERHRVLDARPSRRLVDDAPTHAVEQFAPGVAKAGRHDRALRPDP